MLATIHKVGTGTCIWCCIKVEDAIDVSFNDGLKGTLCRKCFGSALKVRAANPQPLVKEPSSKGSM
jgi:hypothetical protein